MDNPYIDTHHWTYYLVGIALKLGPVIVILLVATVIWLLGVMDSPSMSTSEKSQCIADTLSWECANNTAR